MKYLIYFFLLLFIPIEGNWLKDLLNFEQPIYTTDRLIERDKNKKSVEDVLFHQTFNTDSLNQLFQSRVDLHRHTPLLDTQLTIEYYLTPLPYEFTPTKDITTVP